MKIALASDELYPVHDFVLNWLRQRGHELILFGALKTHQEEPWVAVAHAAAEAVRQGTCDEGIFCCWTGTGICMAANKMPGIRAALCPDAETARGARIWNHANVLVLSNRLLTTENASEILSAWFEDFDLLKGAGGVADLKALENIA